MWWLLMLFWGQPLARVPEHIYLDWLEMPASCPQNISTAEELDKYITAPFVAARLYGGFGNELFQMAACLATAHALNVNCPVALWTADWFVAILIGRSSPHSLTGTTRLARARRLPRESP